MEISLKNAHDSAAGADEVHYQLLKYLQTLLNIFIRIWEQSTFAECWTKATIIPIPKPNKDHTNLTNYRPIALTSYLNHGENDKQKAQVLPGIQQYHIRISVRVLKKKQKHDRIN